MFFFSLPCAALTGDQVRTQARHHAHRGAEGVSRRHCPRREPHRARGVAARSLPQDGHPLLHHEGQGVTCSRYISFKKRRHVLFITVKIESGEIEDVVGSHFCKVCGTSIARTTGVMAPV